MRTKGKRETCCVITPRPPSHTQTRAWGKRMREMPVLALQRYAPTKKVKDVVRSRQKSAAAMQLSKECSSNCSAPVRLHGNTTLPQNKNPSKLDWNTCMIPAVAGEYRPKNQHCNSIPYPHIPHPQSVAVYLPSPVSESHDYSASPPKCVQSFGTTGMHLNKLALTYDTPSDGRKPLKHTPEYPQGSVQRSKSTLVAGSAGENGLWVEMCCSKIDCTKTTRESERIMQFSYGQVREIPVEGIVKPLKSFV